MRRLIVWVVGVLLLGVGTLTIAAVVAALATRSAQPRRAPATSGRSTPAPPTCTYEFTVDPGFDTATSRPVPGFPFTGAYVMRDSQGRITEVPLSGTAPFMLTLTVQDVALVILPDDQSTAELKLEQVAAAGCTWDFVRYGAVLYRLVQDPSATPNPPMMPVRGYRRVPLPAGVSTSCDPALLKALPWPTPAYGAPQRFTAPVPCPGS